MSGHPVFCMLGWLYGGLQSRYGKLVHSELVYSQIAGISKAPHIVSDALTKPKIREKWGLFLAASPPGVVH